ncbi:hypothetical protein ACFL2Z_00510 [Candidatus Eisenbacteria bacterium]|uniref:DUF4390 domain-containing protein n=1 Tax=Eiseniibacteriota bacterium TaxID=2212470 RepID=A0ABV6YMT0_UNCEI
MATVRNMMSLGLAVWLICTAAVCIAADERPAIVDIDLHAEDGYLTADITARGLFSERITGTVQSGLPAVVELFYHLVGPGGSSLEGGVRSYSLQYDVWDDVYSVSGPDSTMMLPSLEAMRSIIEHMKSIPLFPVERMVPERTYFVQMSIAVSPLQGTQREEMEGWVKQNVESRGSSWHEQMLNINELIERFFSGDDDSGMRSEWFKSEDFKPRLLSAGNKEEE